MAARAVDVRLAGATLQDVAPPVAVDLSPGQALVYEGAVGGVPMVHAVTHSGGGGGLRFLALEVGPLSPQGGGVVEEGGERVDGGVLAVGAGAGPPAPVTAAASVAVAAAAVAAARGTLTRPPPPGWRWGWQCGRGWWSTS